LINILPNGDISDSNVTGSPDNVDLYKNIDEGTTPNSELIGTDETSPQSFEIALGATPVGTTEITNVNFYINAKLLGAGTFTGKPKIGSYLTPKAYSFTSSQGWLNQSWSGSWTKAQIDAMTFVVNTTTTDKSGYMVYSIYCRVTYSSGYSKVINNISGYKEINGIDIANISAWNGIS